MIKLMGILNVTSDSFYDGGRYVLADRAIQHGLQLIAEGVDILDIGGESTRPGASPVPLNEELARVLPVIKALAKASPTQISIDTQKPEVAEAGLEAGATLLNDVGGFRLPRMRELAAHAKVDICVMHMRGNPQNMQSKTFYEEGIMSHLLKWFEERICDLRKSGVQDSQIILDPGIGFGKTVDDNVKIIDNLSLLKSMGFRLLLGASRKSFLSKIVNKSSENVLEETIAVNVLGLQQGVDIIRVHDVKAHRGVVDLMSRFR